MGKVVECTNLEKKYFLFDKDYKIIPWLFTKKGCEKEITPLTNVNLTINEGDVVGFIGKNGAGKSTLMKIIAGITMHTSGGLEVKGKVNSLINLSAGFNPKYTGRQNIYYKGLLMGMSRDDVDKIINEIIDFCELGDYFDLPTYMYSSGMSARLGFALAVFADHDILIVDEVFAVGDKAFKRKSEAKMRELFTSGKSIIFASHSDNQIREFCNRAIFIDESKIVVDGTVDEALNAYNKKYAPNKVQKDPKNFKNEYEKVDDFMNMIDTTVRITSIDLFKQIALLYEYEKEFDHAYYYMALTNKLKPNDEFILQKLNEYSKKITNTDTEIENKFDESLKNIDETRKRMNNRYYEFHKVHLYKELAIFTQLEGDDDIAFRYVSLAKELSPASEFICKKYEELELKLKNK